MVNLKLFDNALLCLQGVHQHTRKIASWRIGGNFALAYQYQHRKVDDIEIIVSDVNFLQALSPRVNDKSASILEHDDSYVEGAACLIIDTEEGRVYFKVEPFLSTYGSPERVIELNDMNVMFETPVEIILKRVTYKMLSGNPEIPIQSFGTEDIFDLACVIQKDSQALLAERSIFALRSRWLCREVMVSSFDHYEYDAKKRIKVVSEEFKPLMTSGTGIIMAFIEQYFLETA